MFRRTAEIIKNQGEKIIELDRAKTLLKITNEQLEKENKELKDKVFNAKRENLSLIGQVDDAEGNTLLILDYIQYILERNNYNNEEMQRRNTLEYIKDMKSNIEEKGLENIIELVHDYQSEN